MLVDSEQVNKSGRGFVTIVTKKGNSTGKQEQKRNPEHVKSFFDIIGKSKDVNLSNTRKSAYF